MGLCHWTCHLHGHTFKPHLVDTGQVVAGTGNYSVLAPVDNAFRNVSVSSLLGNKDLLNKTISAHIIKLPPLGDLIDLVVNITEIVGQPVFPEERLVWPWWCVCGCPYLDHHHHPSIHSWMFPPWRHLVRDSLPTRPIMTTMVWTPCHCSQSPLWCTHPFAAGYVVVGEHVLPTAFALPCTLLTGSCAAFVRSPQAGVEACINS